MRFVGWLTAALMAVSLSPVPAAANILIQVDKSAQRMIVSRDGAALYDWPVSTGLRSYETPSGQFTPFRMERDHFSREWDDAPMPNSIFFTREGHAIHGTEHLRNIGRPASHGCVRLEPQNARMLFDLVKAEGMKNVKVVLFGPTPGKGEVARRDGAMAGPATRGAPPSSERGRWVRRYDGSWIYYRREPGYFGPPPYYGPPPRRLWGWN
jgi:hypothetical protein